MEYLPWGNKQNLTDDEFFNRNYELDNIKRLLASTSQENAPDILLTGVRGVGKTEFLKKIKRDTEGYLTIYMDFSNAMCFQKRNMSIIGLIEYYFNEIIKECEKNNILTLSTKINKFFKTKDYSIKDITSVNGFPVPIPESKDNTKKVLDFVLNLPNEIYNENKDKFKGIIIFIDEFQIIKELNDYLESFLWIFRSYAQNQRNVAYVLSGSMSLQDDLIETIAGHGGVFGGRMLTLNLSPFSKQTVKEYLNEKSPNLLLTDKGFDRFYKCTSGLPSYINTFGRLLPKDVELDDKTVKEEFNMLIPNIATHLLTVWGRLSLKEQNIIISLLDNPLKRKDIANSMKVTSGSLSKSLIKLQNLDLIRFNNNLYEISEPLLAKWLKLEYENKGVYPYRV